MKLWESNHAACEKLSLEVLRHLLAKLCLRNFLSLLNCGSPCIANLRYYFKVESAFVSQLFDTFRDIYGVINWFSIDCVAPFSRINFIQCTEPKSIFEFLWVDVVLKDIRFLLCELYIQMFFCETNGYYYYYNYSRSTIWKSFLYFWKDTFVSYFRFNMFQCIFIRVGL